MGIFFADGRELLEKYVSGSREFFSSIECQLNVYKARPVGPSGFDQFPEGHALVERMLRDSMILSSGEASVPLLHPLDGDGFSIVRKEALSGCLSFGSPDSDLRREVDALEHLRRELKKQALRERYGHPLSPDPPAALKDLFQGRWMDSKLLEFVLRHSSHACIWNWGEFGLHFLSLSLTRGGSRDFIKTAASEQGVALIDAGSIDKIPTW
ncbi:hypothetical protein [Cystobacter fuscus]|uniref:hypothetical protein n=1 Tax=Cystobacter fuscus TaxID=43 RepID=UPI002B292E42|nr:hypothetical protein F0U63_47135 [Cystobacter fuscus]